VRAFVAAVHARGRPIEAGDTLSRFLLGGTAYRFLAVFFAAFFAAFFAMSDVPPFIRVL
jgi:hypothetical protein